VAASVTPVLPTPGPTKSVTPAPIDAPSAAVRRIEGTRAVFLTFDAGAGRGYAMEILDLLAAAGAKASFGLTGTWASENPDIVRRIFREGHTVINHSYDHPSFTGSSSTYVALDRDERLDQLARTETVFASIVPNATSLPYFRPPFGDYDEEVLNDVGGAGYRYTLLWAIDSGGWRDLPVQEIVARVSAATSGDIVILHVASTGDFEALAEILDGLLSRGLSSAAIGDVLR
jgi:peptidoglycan/xylan/chitin deacetylase (PgdA/CDA1 family)